ncbi:hypothetical protein AB2M62_15725 [Sphingomonas sp. MMS12-HWE2-04]|uniref:hypothetical protein n=1 Tax=Sphingomonas sp. MMS12-HWE2-04 TaxID=3234199 RepID=UPI00384F4D63
MPRSLLLLIAALPLAACGSGTGTSIAINAQSDDGNATVSTDGNGQVTIKAPGFEGALKLPPIDISAEDFEINGLRLYPKSKIRSFQADSKGKGTQDDKAVVTFESPAPLAKVQGWFRENLAKHHFKASADGNGFKGTTEDGEPFVLTLDAAGPDKVSGRMVVGK